MIVNYAYYCPGPDKNYSCKFIWRGGGVFNGNGKSGQVGKICYLWLRPEGAVLTINQLCKGSLVLIFTNVINFVWWV